MNQTRISILCCIFVVFTAIVFFVRSETTNGATPHPNLPHLHHHLRHKKHHDKRVSITGDQQYTDFLHRYDILFKNCSKSNVDQTSSINAYRKFPYTIYYFQGRTNLADLSLVHRDTQDVCTTAFDAVSFLSSLRNKRLAIYGDSLSRQHFNGLIAATFAYQHTLLTGREEMDKVLYSHYYPSTNTTISYCEDGFGDRLVQYVMEGIQSVQFCIEPMLHSDILVIGIAAWYKPFFRVSPSAEPDYMLNLNKSSLAFRNDMKRIRNAIMNYYGVITTSSTSIPNHQGAKAKINRTNYNLTNSLVHPNIPLQSSNETKVVSDPTPVPHSDLKKFYSTYSALNRAPLPPSSQPKIIWRLSPHAGRIDEISFFTPTLIGNYSHWDGRIWTEEFANNTAIWVKRYNSILTLLAVKNNDKILDWFSSSMEYMKAASQTFKVSNTIHSDSLHYCLEGFPVFSSLQMADVISEIIHETASV